MHHDDQHIHHQHLQRQQQRRLQQVPPAVANTTAANATRNPTSTTAAGLNATAAEAAEAAAEAVLTPEDIQEMICAVRSYSPVDLRGISNVTCPSSRSRVINAPFGNLTIPIVFHCEYCWGPPAALSAVQPQVYESFCLAMASDIFWTACPQTRDSTGSDGMWAAVVRLLAPVKALSISSSGSSIDEMNSSRLCCTTCLQVTGGPQSKGCCCHPCGTLLLLPATSWQLLTSTLQDQAYSE